MGEPATVPLWLFLAIAAFALWSLLDRLLIPVLPVSLISSVLLGAEGPPLYLPRGDESGDGLFAAAATERPLLAYYANAIVHLR